MSKHSVSYIESDKSISIIVDGKPHNVTDGDLRYPKIKAAINRGDMDEVASLVEISNYVQKYVEDDEIKVSGGTVTWRGHEIKNVVTDKLVQMMREGSKDGARFIKFLKKLLKNPSKNSVEQLYRFLAHLGMPITESGNFLCYKGVQESLYSKHGNTKTIVLQGQKDINGRIFNGIGETVEVLRSCVSEDPNCPCHEGLHAGDITYAKSWGEVVVLVEVDPADVVSIPKDESSRKMRVCKYKVVGKLDEDTEKDMQLGALDFEDGKPKKKFYYDEIEDEPQDFSDEEPIDYYTNQYWDGVLEPLENTKSNLSMINKNKIENYLNRAFERSWGVKIKNVQKAVVGVTCQEIVDFINKDLSGWMRITEGTIGKPSTYFVSLK